MLKPSNTNLTFLKLARDFITKNCHVSMRTNLQWVLPCNKYFVENFLNENIENERELLKVYPCALKHNPAGNSQKS